MSEAVYIAQVCYQQKILRHPTLAGLVSLHFTNSCDHNTAGNPEFPRRGTEKTGQAGEMTVSNLCRDTIYPGVFLIFPSSSR